MKALLPALLAAGCIAEAQLGTVPPGYEYCEDGTRWDHRCEDYYIWVEPSYTVYGYWHPGHWELRPGYHHYRPVVRGHRR